jgi:hypothetical protein
MLPGFRFLLAAIVSSMSLLVFGLGAAALLRAAHEEFSSTPSWRAAPETMFAQQGQATPPVLAMLRVEPVAMEQKPSDNVPAVAAPVEPATILSAPAEPAVSAPMPAEPERIAALKPDASIEPESTKQPESTKSKIPAAESPTQGEVPPVQADAPISSDAPARVAETKIPATEEVLPPVSEAVPPAAEAMPKVAEQTSAPVSPEADITPTQIATLSDPSITVAAKPPAKAASAKPEDDLTKKRLQARRAAQRRRIAAARARAAQQQALQQGANPFAPFAQQPVATPSR